MLIVLTSPGTWKKKKIESKGELEDKRDHLDKSDLSQQFIVVTEASQQVVEYSKTVDVTKNHHKRGYPTYPLVLPVSVVKYFKSENTHELLPWPEFSMYQSDN